MFQSYNLLVDVLQHLVYSLLYPENIHIGCLVIWLFGYLYIVQLVV